MIKIISIITSNNRTTVDWVIEDKIGIEPQPFWIEPGCRNEIEAQSWALSTLLPIAAALNISIDLPYPIPANVLNFWNLKLGYISKFFIDGLQVNVNPVGGECGSNEYSPEKLALLMGGGSDSLSTLGKMIDVGEKPTLLRITEVGYFDCDPLGVGYRYLDELSDYYNLKLKHVATNAHKVQAMLRPFVTKYIDTSVIDPLVASVASRSVVNYLFAGFQYFFTSLSALPEDAGTIILSSSKDDVSEWAGMGFNWDNSLPFLGIGLETRPWENKIEQYIYLKNEHPEMLKWQKSCPSPNRQWCGNCWQCQMSRINMLAARFDCPIEATMNKVRSSTSPFVRKVERAIQYYCDNGIIDPLVLVELKKRAYG